MNLKLQNISKSFQQADVPLRILENLNLDLSSGEIIAIIGESGSGKSTLLSLLAGFDRPDRGVIEWEGRAVSEWTEKNWADFRKREIGFVFQNYHLIPYLTALENAALPLKLIGDARAEETARGWLGDLGLTDRASHLPSELSGGECQRVAIARALVHKPQLLLADEPTGSLDARTGQVVLDLLFELLQKYRQTALIVTHSQEVASRCHRVLTLRQGQLWSS